MRQEEKRAAAAARELLDAAAARERKVATAHSRKGSASAQPRKGTGRTAAPKQKGVDQAAAASGGGFDATTPPKSFSDGSNFFTGAGSFFTNAGHSPMYQPTMLPQPSDPTFCVHCKDNDLIPSGGFTNLIHPHLSQNFHFVGAPSHYAPFKPPRHFDVSPSEGETSTPHSSMENNKYINVDSGDEVVRTEKRILWTQEEDVRLMSSWLHNSTDPAVGADRKNEQYWGDVIETYNNTTPSHRRRNAKQAKDRWHKINKWTDLFHNSWLKAQRIYTSGHNDQMWIDKAHEFYEQDNKGLGHFVLINVWYAVRNEPKWITYNKGLKEARKRKISGKDKAGEDIEHIDLEEPEECPRPMGQKKAKKAAHDKKAKSKGTNNDIEELHTYSKIQSEEHANRLKVLEVQQKLSSEKLESARIAHLAAKEQKEAKKV